MNYIELKEQLVIPFVSVIDTPEEPEPTSEHFSEEMFRFHFWDLYRFQFRDYIDEIADELNAELEKRSSFFVKPEKEEEYYFSEIMKSQKSYLKNQYARIFSVDNFVSDYSTLSTFDALADLIYYGNENKFSGWSVGQYNGDYYTPDLLDLIIEEVDAIDEAFRLVIWINFLKSKLKDFQNRNNVVPNSSDLKKHNRLSRNQLVILMDRLGLLLPLEDKTVVSRAKIIAEITGHNYSNVKKSIEGLEKRPNDLGIQEKKDLEKVENFLKEL